MLLIHPLLLVIDRIPQYQLTIHPATGHKLQFRHSYHRRYHKIDLLLGEIPTLLFIHLAVVRDLLLF